MLVTGIDLAYFLFLKRNRLRYIGRGYGDGSADLVGGAGLHNPAAIADGRRIVVDVVIIEAYLRRRVRANPGGIGGNHRAGHADGGAILGNNTIVTLRNHGASDFGCPGVCYDGSVSSAHNGDILKRGLDRSGITINTESVVTS